MKNMFSNCKTLKFLNLFNFNINKVIDMSEMFSNCNSLESLNLYKFTTANVINMYNMFSNCSSLNDLIYLILIQIMLIILKESFLNVHL